MATVVTTNALGNFTYDGVFVVLESPSPQAQTGPNTSVFGAVGSAAWGPDNTPVGPAGSPGQLYDLIGQVTNDQHDLATAGALVFTSVPGSNATGYFVRVTDSTDTAAIIPVLSSASNSPPLFNVSGKYTGSRPNNGATVVVTQNAAYTAANPLYDITLTMPLAPGPERFTGISAASGGMYNAATFAANAIAAINKGINNQRGPSKYWVASSVSSPSGTPITGFAFTPSTLGTDGRSGITSAILIGQDAVTAAGRTGMYALRSLGTSQFFIMGNNDPTTGPAMQSFAQDELTLAVGPVFPTGTDTPTCVATKLTDNVSSAYIWPQKDWVYWQDTVNGVLRLVDPSPCAIATLCSINPEQSPGNKPYGGISSILGTERTYPVNIPYSGAETAQLVQAGIGFINAMPRSASLLGYTHGQNGGNPGLLGTGEDGVNWTRMTNYLIRLIFAIGGPFVDELQGTSEPDPTRDGFVGALKVALNILAAPNGNGQKRIDKFQVTADLTNNTPVTIAEGFLLAQVLVRYLGTARFIVPVLLANNQVQIVTGPASGF